MHKNEYTKINFEVHKLTKMSTYNTHERNEQYEANDLDFRCFFSNDHHIPSHRAIEGETHENKFDA